MSRWVLAVLLLLAGCRGRPEVPILAYHSIGKNPDGYTVSRAAFAEQLDWLVSNRYTTASLRDLAQGKLPRRAVILTFDDGKEDALSVVAAMLRERRLRASFFIITGLVGTPGYLDWDGVRALAAAGMEIGSHTVHHFRLSELPVDRVRAELVESKRELEARLGWPVEALAYPFNSSRRRLVQAAKEAGYRVAVSGAAHGGAGVLELYRFPVTGYTPLAELEKFVLSAAKN